MPYPEMALLIFHIYILLPAYSSQRMMVFMEMNCGEQMELIWVHLWYSIYSQSPIMLILYFGLLPIKKLFSALQIIILRIHQFLICGLWTEILLLCRFSL